MTDNVFDRVAADLEYDPVGDEAARRQAENRAPVTALAVEGRVAIKGTDAPLERAVDALAGLTGEIDKAAATLADEVRRGADPDRVARLHAGVLRTVEVQLKARAATATTELEAARSRCYAALLPDVTDDDALAPDRKADIERALRAADGDPTQKFTTVWQRFAGKGDRLALRLLANDFGRDAFVTAAGGRADAYDRLRDGLRTQWAASPAMKDNPLVKTLTRLTGPKARAAVDATAADIQLALGGLARAARGKR